ncbi:MAG: hypothetical protein FWE27_04915 [Defluviitaleaceae bacterium]|nr:hypothetical protein [Defluviitaleaceae bacterium]
MVLADLFRILIGLFITVAVILILHTAAVLPFLNADTTGVGLTKARSGLYTTGVSAQEILSDTRNNPFTAAHIVMLPAVDAEILQSRMEVEGVNAVRNIRIMEELSFRPTTTSFTLHYTQTLASMHNRQITLAAWAGQDLGHIDTIENHERGVGNTLAHGTGLRPMHDPSQVDSNGNTIYYPPSRFNIMVHGEGSRSTVHFFTSPKPERLIWGLHSPLPSPTPQP